MQFHSDDMTMSAPEPSREDVFRGIAASLYSALHPALVAIANTPPADEANPDYRAYHAMQWVTTPLETIAANHPRSTPYGRTLKAGFDRLLTEFPAIIAAPGVREAVETANAASGFWEWATTQPKPAERSTRIGERDTGHGGRG